MFGRVVDQMGHYDHHVYVFMVMIIGVMLMVVDVFVVLFNVLLVWAENKY